MNKELYMLMYDTWNNPDCDAMWAEKPTADEQSMAAFWLASVGV